MSLTPEHCSTDAEIIAILREFNLRNVPLAREVHRLRAALTRRGEALAKIQARHDKLIVEAETIHTPVQRAAYQAGAGELAFALAALRDGQEEK